MQWHQSGLQSRKSTLGNGMARTALPLPEALKSGAVTPRIDAYVDLTVFHYINACLCTYQHYFSSLFREAQQLNNIIIS
jgi:hypothetical protein